MKPHALIISTKHPLPTDDGQKATLAAFVDYLVERFGAENCTYVVVGRPAPLQAALPCRTLWVDPPGAATQAWQGLRSLCALTPLSLQEALTRSRRIERRLKQIAAQCQPQLLVLDLLRIGQYFDAAVVGTAPRRVLYMADLYHLRFRRMCEMAAKGLQFAPAGTFWKLLPAPARSALQFAPLRNLLYRIEADKVERRELAAPHRFDQCLLANVHEAALLRERCAGGRLEAIQPALFAAQRPRERRFDGRPTFLLLGSLRHPLYRASVLQFMAEAMDAIVAAMPEVRILIVGEGADAELRASCEARAPHVELLGFVDDIAPLFGSACALLVPSIVGGGLRMKALTAMFHGLPIISTSAGIDGIPLMDRDSFLREDRIALFAEPMQRLCEPVTNAAVSRAADTVFAAHYGRAQVFRQYDALFGLSHAD